MTLSSADLDSIRATAETALPDTVTIERVNEVPDGAGGRTQDWQPVYVDIPARLSEKAGGIPGQRQEAGTESGWTLTLSTAWTVSEKDRVRTADGRTFEIVFVNQGRSYATTRRCRLRILW